MKSKLFNNVYQGKKVFITGHCGFKGSWLSFWLTKLGAKVTGYSLLNDYEKHTKHMREYYRDTIGQLLRAGRGSVSDST